jgi:hypothetical protein
MPISIWGITTNNTLFPYRNTHMETGIETSPYGNGEGPFPYGESNEMASCCKTGIPMWKRGLTHPHMEMGSTHFHMGNQKIRLPIFIWESPYRNKDCHIPIWKWKMPISIWGNTTNDSLFSYRDPHMETGIESSPYRNGECPFPYGE